MRRRDFAKTAALALAAGPSALPARESSYAEQYPDMLISFLSEKLNRLAAKWDEERGRIRTAEDVAARNRFVRQKLGEMLGPFPARNPLNPVVVRSLQRRGYRIENLMFESRPNFWVTGNLYLPAGNGPFPAVISPCGHYPRARMEPEYQFAYLSLVHAGFIVLAYDPVGQGERRQYWNPETGQTEVHTASTYEHSMPGQVQLLYGENLTNYRVWDGMRAIDYLLTRKDVDPARIGCAGHSGGATLTMFISAFDERVKCAVINEGGTGHRWPQKLGRGGRLGPSDVEQNIFPGALNGVDGCDMHVAVAPRPLLALIEDYSPRFNSAAEHIRERYRQMGVPEKFATDEATDPHSWTMKLRLATTDWFCRWFYNRRGPEREPDFEPEAEKTLHCTPNGSIRYSGKGDTVFTLIARKRESLPERREVTADVVKRVLHLREPSGALAPRLLVTTPRKRYKVDKVEFLSEPGIYIPAWVFLPDNPNGAPALVYVNEGGKETDGQEFDLLERMARRGQVTVAVDVRGVGGTTPPHVSASLGSGTPFGHLFDVETAMTYMTWFMDESLFGMRVLDTIRSVDYTLSRPDVAKGGVRMIGRGMGALLALYAAALDRRIQKAVCDSGLLSYRSLMEGDRYLHGANVFLRGVLNHFDLPDVARLAGPERLVLVGPVDGMKRPAGADSVRRLYPGVRFAPAEGDRTEQYLSLSV